MRSADGADVQGLAAAAALSHLPAGRLEVDGASSVRHCAFHSHEEIPLGAQLFAFLTKATTWNT